MSATAKKWFVSGDDQQIQGPLTSDEAETLFRTLTKPLIWGRGLTEWLTPVQWKEALSNQGAALSETTPREEPHWKYRYAGTEYGPFVYADLLEDLRKVTDYGDVTVFGEGFTAWTEIYGVQQLVDELGITRRAHPRVPIMGNLKIETAQGPVDALVTTISEGGCGITNSPPMTIGEKFRAELTSPNLFVTINCICEVVYVGPDGSTGLRFHQLPTETQSALVEYVNKFKSA